MFAEMGHLARQHPDELLFGLLKSGFTELCFDGQYYSDTDHPAVDEDGNVVSVSNMQDGTATPWYLLDTSRAIRPLIWQERDGYEFQSVPNPKDTRVFMSDEHLYGVRVRVNAGFGLRQMGFASKVDLTADTYAAARAAMQMYRGDTGRILGVKPTIMVVPPSLEAAALDILNSALTETGGTNKWAGTAELVVTPNIAE